MRCFHYYLAVYYGANITLVHYGINNFLHSHVQTYPLRYDDGRVSSQGQQVTGYPHNDTNNVWQFVPVDGRIDDEGEEAGTLSPRMVRHMDVVRLRHTNTGRYLLTHDVASPLTPTNMEVTCIDDEDRLNETYWRVEIQGGEDEEGLATIDMRFRLIHTVQPVALHMHKGSYGEWGFGQQEVNGNKAKKDSTNLWMVHGVQGQHGTSRNSILCVPCVSTPIFYASLKLSILIDRNNYGS